MGKLRIITDGVHPSVHPLEEGSNTVGRDPANLVPLDHESLSEFHCELIDQGDSLLVRDLGSMNGTFVDGEPAADSVALPGEVIRIGLLEVVYEEGAAAIRAAAPVEAAVAGEPAHEPEPAGVESFAAPAGEADSAVPEGSAPPIMEPEAESGPPKKQKKRARPCPDHPHNRLTLVCTQCEKRLCRECVREHDTGVKLWLFCPVCNGECLSRKEARKKRKLVDTRPFLKRLPEVFKYPLTKDGLILLVVGNVILAVVGVMFYLMRGLLILGFGGLVFWLLATFFLATICFGYLFSFMQNIILDTARGEDDLPNWPDFSDLFSDMVIPFFRVVVLVLVCMSPFLAFIFFTVSENFEPSPAILLSLIAFGFLYFPMALLAMAMHDDILAMNPLVVIPAIVRIPKEYAIATGAFFLALGLGRILVMVLDFVPVLGFLIGNLVGFYLLIIDMRIIGLMYYTNRKEFGWFKET